MENGNIRYYFETSTPKKAMMNSTIIHFQNMLGQEEESAASEQFRGLLVSVANNAQLGPAGHGSDRNVKMDLAKRNVFNLSGQFEPSTNDVYLKTG